MGDTISFNEYVVSVDVDTSMEDVMDVCVCVWRSWDLRMRALWKPYIFRCNGECERLTKENCFDCTKKRARMGRETGFENKSKQAISDSKHFRLGDGI